MTGDDLKRLQDSFFTMSTKIIQEKRRLRPIGFVITMHKHVDKLLESGWALQFIDPKAILRDHQDDAIATLIIDLAMDWKRLYHAALDLLPKARKVLPPMIQFAETAKVDDPYKRVMRPFLEAAQLNEKDIIAGTMRKVCGEVDAFASVMQTEAWMRRVDPSDKAAIEKANREGLGGDAQSIEIVISSMETYDFTRILTIPVQRAAPKAGESRDEGAVTGFGERAEILRPLPDADAETGRFERFLKPLGEAS